MVVQLLLCQMLLSEFVQNNKQNPCVVPIQLFFMHFVSIQIVQPYSSTDPATIWENSKMRIIGSNDVEKSVPMF